jgi:transposase InsO family protein
MDEISTPSYFSIQELASLVEVSDRNVRYRLKSVSDFRSRNAGKGREYPLGALPPEWQGILRKKIGKQDNERANSGVSGSKRDLDAAVDPDTADHADLCEQSHESQIGAVPPTQHEINHTYIYSEKTEPSTASYSASLQIEESHDGEKNEKTIDAWRYLLAIQDLWCEDKLHLRRVDCDTCFAIAYNEGDIQAPGWILEAVPKLSRATIARKRARKDMRGVDGLGRKNAKRLGRVDLNEDIRDAVIAMLATHPRCSAKDVYKLLLTRHAEEDVPAKSTLHRWMQQWKQGNHEIWTAMTSPDRWKNHYMSAFGDADYKVERLYEVLEADSTPADLLLQDGRHSILGLIDVYSREIRFLVSKTSKSESLCTLLRHWCIEKGVPETLKTDNGKDYVSHRFRRSLDSLNVAHRICAPFSPERKPYVERVFGTFNHDLLKLLEGYIGHDVATRQEIRGQNSFSDRMFKRGAVVEAGTLSSTELQSFCDDWAKIYNHEPHEGMGGETPFERVTNWRHPVRKVEDPRTLDILLAEGKTATITKKGVRFDNAYFAHPDLALKVKDKVQLRFDPLDLGRVFVFDLDYQFICVAECFERLGINPAEAANLARSKQRKAIAEKKAEIRAIKAKHDVGNAAKEIMEARLAEIDKVRALPAPVEPHETAAISGAMEALQAEGDRQRVPAQSLPRKEESPKPEEPRDLFCRVLDRWDSGRLAEISAEDLAVARRLVDLPLGKAALILEFEQDHARAWEFRKWLNEVVPAAM